MKKFNDIISKQVIPWIILIIVGIIISIFADILGVALIFVLIGCFSFVVISAFFDLIKKIVNESISIERAAIVGAIITTSLVISWYAEKLYKENELFWKYTWKIYLPLYSIIGGILIAIIYWKLSKEK